MNEWGKKTRELALRTNYLDRLYEIYPGETRTRTVSAEKKNEIKRYLKTGDDKSLLRCLLRLEKFPIKDSYVDFLRKYDKAVENNPRTVKRICEAIKSLGYEGIVSSISAPPEANRVRGPQFKNWLKNHFRFAPMEGFMKTVEGIILLEAHERVLRDFANQKLNLGLIKRPDFVARVSGKFVVGEAKFLSAVGGEQSAGFREGIDLVRSRGTGIKVFIADGVIWVAEGSGEYREIEASTGYIFSGLLLRDFLDSIL
jgi:hypothetical protein